MRVGCQYANSWVFTSCQKPPQAAAVLLPPIQMTEVRLTLSVPKHSSTPSDVANHPPTPPPFRKLLERGRGKWSFFQQLVRRVPREYSEPFTSQASGRVIKRMGREKLAPAPPFSPSLCSCCTTLTGVSCHSAWLHAEARWLGLGGGRDRKGERGDSFASLYLSLSLSRYYWNSTPNTTADHPLLPPAPSQPVKHDSEESEANPDTLSPRSGVCCVGVSRE